MPINKKLIEENPQILTTEKVNIIIGKENKGLPLTKYDRIWFKGYKGIRKPGLIFAWTDEEINEYAKCKLSVHYFAEKYCQIKREDGTVGPLKLRDYQKRIITLFDENRYSILMASRQCGKCTSFTTTVQIDGFDKPIPLGILYFQWLKQIRHLTFLEKIKFFLYRIYLKS